ncbi:MAG TPA: hypothetical protein P5567_02340 [Kiritimatiellia bacterium]|nr:hypothetical protein [Kiritimatiellia bacterium]HSA19123.1 hypothetical protein [Kiritimatiellia bacterium]
MKHASHIAFAIFAAWLLGCGLAGRPVLHGDAREYILQTQAIALRGQLQIEPARAAAYWNRTNPYGLELGETRPPSWPLNESAQAGGGFGALYPDRFGAWRFAHFWAYSAVVAPLYGLLHLAAPAAEYAAFRIVNAAFLLLPFLLAWRRGGNGRLLIVMALAVFSPLIPYTDWAHPELFCFALVLASFQLASGPRGRWFAPALLGLAATQNPPILLFFPLLLARAISGPDRPAWRKVIPAFGAGALIGLLPVFYSIYYFQDWNIIQAVGQAQPAYATLARAMHFFISPLVGAVWIFPACFLFLPVCIRRSNVVFAIAALLSVFLAAWASSATANFNAGQVGALRYAVWALAPLWFLVFDGMRKSLDGRARKAQFLAAVLLNVLLILAFKYERLPRKDVRLVAGCRRATPPVAALVRRLHYPDDIEVLVENIVGRELPGPRQFDGVYVWNLAPDASLWIISRRAVERGLELSRPMASGLRLEARPPGSLSVEYRDGVALLRVNAEAGYARHPVWGDYLFAWANRALPATGREPPWLVIR